MAKAGIRQSAFASLFIFATATAYCAESTAAPTSFFGSLPPWLTQDTATGNWGGLRDKLGGRGIDITANYTTDFLGNPSGGIKQTTAYAGFLELSAAINFEKLVNARGLALTISNFLASGRNLSDDIGNFFGVQEIYSPGNYWFGEVDLSLALFNDKLVLETGRLFAGDVFATSPLFQYYVSGGVNGNLDLASNILFPAFDVTSWAARATYEPNSNWNVAAGIYNGDTRVSDPKEHGLLYNLNTANGCLAIGQVTYSHSQERDDNNYPGSVAAGYYYDSGEFPDLSDATRTHRGNQGFYVIADQMVYRGDWPQYSGPDYRRAGAGYAERARQPYHPQTAIPRDRPKGLTAWFGGYVAPQQHYNTLFYQGAGGLVYQGLPPNRDRDVTAFAVIVGRFSDELSGMGTETVLELNHRLQLGNWFYVTPDIQYIIHPNGNKNIDSAIVLGLEASVNF